MHKVEVVGNKPVLFGESPLWDNRRQQLVFIDCFGNSVNIFDPSTNEIATREVKLPGEELKYVILGMPYASSQNKFLVPTSAQKFVEYDWESDKVTKVLFENPDKLLAFNDAKCDSKGRYWTGAGKFSSLAELKTVDDQGVIFAFSKSGNGEALHSSEKGGQFDLPNGLGFNKEGNKLFWNDLTKRVINAFDFDTNAGKLGNRKTLLDYGKFPELDGSFPDGLCMDVNGNIWVACWKGSCVIQVDAQTGKIVGKIPLPVTNTTSVAFGGDKYEKLFVTTTSIELSTAPVEGQPDAGKLFQITNPKDNSFKGFQEYFIDL